LPSSVALARLHPPNLRGQKTHFLLGNQQKMSLKEATALPDSVLVNAQNP
jgi:hypothetical protein